MAKVLLYLGGILLVLGQILVLIYVVVAIQGFELWGESEPARLRWLVFAAVVEVVVLLPILAGLLLRAAARRSWE